MHIQSESYPKGEAGDGQALDGVPPLALVCPEVFDSGALCAILAGDRQIGPRLTLEEASDMLDSDSSARLVLLVEDCSAFVARRQSQDSLPNAAAAEWQEAVRPVLLLLRAHRRRILLHRIAMVQCYSESLVKRLALSERTVRALRELPYETADPIRTLLAEMTVLRSPELRRLNGEIEASSEDLSNGATRDLPDPDQVSAWLKQLKADISRQNEAQTTIEARICMLTGQIEERDQRIIDAKAEQTLMSEILRQVQKEVEIRYSELREMAEKLTEERHKTLKFYNKAIEYMVENKNLQAEKDRVTTVLSAVTASRSYRMMAPLRRLRAALGR